MKTEFKAKFLQNISKKRGEEGFTLIELLVVIIIIGILSAIALPSFLNQANKAKQSEAKQYIASINKGQQAYYVENGRFHTSADVLGLGIKTATSNYTYTLTEQTINAKSGVSAYTSAAAAGLRAYGGSVFLVTAGDADSSQTILCETTGPNPAPGAMPATSVCSGVFSNAVNK